MLNAADCMPTDKHSLTILKERSKHFAILSEEKKDQEEVSYIKFRLGKNDYYGIPYFSAKEVIQNAIITQLPNTPSIIAGTMNWRGILLTLLNVNHLFLNQSISLNDNMPIIVITAKGTTVGIVTDYIEGSGAYNPALLETSLTVGTFVKPEYIVGLHEGSIAILNVEAIVKDVKSQLK